MIRSILTFTAGFAAAVFVAHHQALRQQVTDLRQHLDDAHETLADLTWRDMQEDEILDLPPKQVEWPESLDLN